MELEEYTFRDLLSRIVDNRGKTCPTTTNGTALIATNCIKANQLYPVFENVRWVDSNTMQTWFRGHPEVGDILFVTKGSPGRCCLTPDPVNFCIAQDMLSLRADESKVSQRFLFALLRSSIVQNAIENLHVGTMIPHFKKGDFNQLILQIPKSRKIQDWIGDVYFTLSNKIELNRRMNATLEGMAQALFKSWFVDFEPVIDNAIKAGNPIPEEFAERTEVRRQALAAGTANREAAKQFPAAFQLTEGMGWIPMGWQVKSFESLAKLDTTSVKPFEQPETIWEHYSIPSYDSSGMPSWDKGSEIKSNKYLVKPGAILSSKLNPETERTWWPFMIDKNRSICSTEFMQFVPQKYEEQAFIYSLIRSEPFQSNILERVTGSTGSRQRAQPRQIAEIAFNDCGELLRTEYIKVAFPLFQSIRNNSIQIKSLTSFRDTLLPKLISGELRIPEAEKLIEEVMA